MPMTPDKAELIGTISGELTEKLDAILRANHDKIDVLNLMLAVGVACKSIGMVLRHNNPDAHDQREVEHEMILSFVSGMTVPNSAVRLVDMPGDGPLKSGIIPVRRH